jgi:TetR/AcrR family transcriptional repressor of lmrAB and yxaGH operons
MARQSSRERMLGAAETLLRERGLAGAGIQQVVARSGAPIGSLYHFFPRGKTQLVAEALQINGDKARALFERTLADTDQPLPERLRRLFRTAASGFDRAGANKGCAIGAVALDLDASHEALRIVCAEVLEAWIASIARELPWPDQAARRSFAELVVASLEGAFILSRARKSGEPFITIGESLAAMLERLPQAPRRRTTAKQKRST